MGIINFFIVLTHIFIELSTNNNSKYFFTYVLENPSCIPLCHGWSSVPALPNLSVSSCQEKQREEWRHAMLPICWHFVKRYISEFLLLLTSYSFFTGTDLSFLSILWAPHSNLADPNPDPAWNPNADPDLCIKWICKQSRKKAVFFWPRISRNFAYAT